MSEHNLNRVEIASGGFVRVSCEGEKIKDLVRAGFVSVEPNIYEISAESDAQKATILKFLRDLKFVFSGGREWSPSEVFQHLRDAGLLDQSFEEIVWIGNGECRIRLV